MTAPKCDCPECSPFNWRGTPSIIGQEKSVRAAGNATLSQSHKATLMVEEQRAAGKNPGYLRDISKKREQDLTRIKDFTVYSKAVRDKVLFERVKPAKPKRKVA